MEKTSIPSFRLLGLKLPGKTTNENGQSGRDCGHLWQQFEKNSIFDRIPDKLSSGIYAVYFDYEKDETKPFSYFIGCRVKENSPIPEGLEELQISFQIYRKLTAKGTMTACITEAWEEIWQADIARKFAFDFEVYDERSRDWKDAEVDIFISVSE